MKNDPLKPIMDLYSDGVISEAVYKDLIKKYLVKEDTLTDEEKKKQQIAEKFGRGSAERGYKFVEEYNKREYEKELDKKRQEELAKEQKLAENQYENDKEYLKNMKNAYGERVYSDEEIEEMSFFEAESLVDSIKNKGYVDNKEVVVEEKVTDIHHDGQVNNTEKKDDSVEDLIKDLDAGKYGSFSLNEEEKQLEIVAQEEMKEENSSVDLTNENNNEQTDLYSTVATEIKNEQENSEVRTMPQGNENLNNDNVNEKDNKVDDMIQKAKNNTTYEDKKLVSKIRHIPEWLKNHPGVLAGAVVAITAGILAATGALPVLGAAVGELAAGYVGYKSTLGRK